MTPRTLARMKMTRKIGKRLPTKRPTKKTTLLRSPLFLSLTQLLGGLESLGRRGNKPRKVNGAVTSRDCKHTPFTHFPKDPDCEICNQGKIIAPRADLNVLTDQMVFLLP